MKARYPLEFKREAVRLVHGAKKISAVSQTLGVSGPSLDNWVKASMHSINSRHLRVRMGDNIS